MPSTTLIHLTINDNIFPLTSRIPITSAFTGIFFPSSQCWGLAQQCCPTPTENSALPWSTSSVHQTELLPRRLEATMPLTNRTTYITPHCPSLLIWRFNGCDFGPQQCPTQSTHPSPPPTTVEFFKVIVVAASFKTLPLTNHMRCATFLHPGFFR